MLMPSGVTDPFGGESRSVRGMRMATATLSKSIRSAWASAELTSKSTNSECFIDRFPNETVSRITCATNFNRLLILGSS